MSSPFIKRRYSKEEFASRGDAIYEKDVRPKLKTDDDGKFPAIDVESGDYAVDEDELAACDKLRHRVPGAAVLDGPSRFALCPSLRRTRTPGELMISGVVTAHEPGTPIHVKGREGLELWINAVINTGYTGSLTLHPTAVAELKLNWQNVDRGILADGSECLFDVYEAEVKSDGQLRRILVDEANTDSLVREMALLIGYELRVEVCSEGKVEIAPLSPSQSQL